MQVQTINRRRLLAGAAALGAAGAFGFQFRGAAAQDAATATPPAGAASWVKFNLNAATDEQLLTVPGAGDRMLREFREYAPYATIATFRKEIGKYVDEATVAGYEAYLFVPVDPATADEATLGQLPGVSADLAAELVKSVPFADANALLAALQGQISAEQLAQVPAYLAGTAAAEAPWTKFDLNAATDEQLLTVPGAGDRMLREFREYAPYTTIATFRKEIGKYVDEATVAGYERYLFVPVDPAAADEATLAQLPGVDADIAGELAKGVPFADANALLSALGAVVSAEQLALAPAYLVTA